MKRIAFTLAELLIVITIIGVVAAMTIPTIIQKKQEKETISKLKKVYSTLSNAYTLAIQEDGTPDNWDLKAADSSEGSINMMNIMLKQLKTLKICGIDSGCFPDNSYLRLDGVKWGFPNKFNFISKAILTDNTIIYFQVNSPDCSTYEKNTQISLKNNCGTIGVDINGFQKPNRKGLDLFYFMINKSGIYPFGAAEDKIVPFETYCYGSGFSCTAWVLYNENMDYIHCSGLSWSGKHTCN